MSSVLSLVSVGYVALEFLLDSLGFNDKEEFLRHERCHVVYYIYRALAVLVTFCSL